MKHFFWILFVSLFTYPVDAAVWYVNINAGGAGDGSSWTNAYTDLQSAFSSATSGDSIWVAKGTYRPTTGTDRSVYFRLKNGVSLFGGFSGNETSVNARNISSNLTVLSGDIGNPGNASDNTYHVVYGSNLSSTVVVDGFRVTGGQIGSGAEGAGFYLDNCKVIIRNCHITDNSGGLGGGIYQYNGNLQITDCRINDNYATSHTGAAIYCKGTGGSTSVYNTQFRNNVVDPSAAAGILFVSGDLDLLVDRCEFSGNNAKSWGIISTNSRKTCKIINTSIIGNYCREAKYISNSGSSGSDFSVINCTIADNLADSTQINQGNYPVIYVPNTLRTREILNCIVYGNTGSVDFSNGLSVKNCVLGRTYSNAVNSMIVHPAFIKQGDRFNAPFVLTGLDYGLHITSPAIDAGDSSFLSTGDKLDLPGNKRILGYNADIGALERQYCKLTVSVLASGPKAFCKGDSVMLYADSGNSRKWNNGMTTPGIQVKTAGHYTVVAADTLRGCRGVASDSVITYESSVTVSGKMRFCRGDSGMLYASGNGVKYLWSTLDTAASIVVTDEGEYKVQSTTAQGCVSLDSVMVTVDSLPVPAISITENSGKANNDAILCKGAGISLQASGGTAYLWSDSSRQTQLNLTPGADMFVAVQASNSRGCLKWSDSIRITVHTLPVPGITFQDNSGIANNDGEICAGDSVLLISKVFPAYSWNTGSKQQMLRLKPASGATYTVTVTDSNNCQNQVSATVVVNALPVPVITKSGHALQTGSFSSYKWFVNDTLIPGATGSSIIPSRNGRYKVEVENNKGCNNVSSAYQFSVSLEELSAAAFRVFPNPGNELLQITAASQGHYRLQILNAPGQLMFSADMQEDMQLDIREWPAGIYSIQLLDEASLHTIVYRFVKI